MSTLWTPSGEHHVPRAPAGGTGSGDGGGSGEDKGAPLRPGRAGQGAGSGAGAGKPTEGEMGETEAEMEAIREEILSTPAESVISNHALGLWQLAALHLSARPPQLPQAQLAIDALAALLEGLGGRLGEDEKTLADGLTQLRMAFVQIANTERAKQDAG